MLASEAVQLLERFIDQYGINCLASDETWINVLDHPPCSSW
jgi:hypothetical protein